MTRRTHTGKNKNAKRTTLRKRSVIDEIKNGTHDNQESQEASKEALGEHYSKLYDSYHYFVDSLWKEIGHDQLAPLGPTERDMLNWIQSGPVKRGVLAPRGIGKTTFGTAPYACWRLLRDPDSKIIVVSKSAPAAKKMIKMLRGWIDTVPFLTHLSPRPEYYGRSWRDNNDMFDVGPSKNSKDPSVLAIGVDGQLENARAHVIIADDVETEGNTQTRMAREELWRRVNQFTAIATFGKREILFFGTYHHEESLYLEENKKGVTFRTWTLIYPDTAEQRRILNLAPSLQRSLDDGEKNPGDIVFDHRHDTTYVEEQRARGRTYFAMQQQLIADLGDADRYPLRLADLIMFRSMKRDIHPIKIAWGQTHGSGKSTYASDIKSRGFGTDGLYEPIFFDGQWAKYQGVRMWIDPAKGGSGRVQQESQRSEATHRRATGDKIGYAIVGFGSGHLWVLAVGGVSGGPVRLNLERLVKLAREYGADEIHVEDFALQSIFAELLEPIARNYYVDPGHRDEAGKEYADGWRAPVLCTKPPLPQSQKERRIIGVLDPIMSQHRLVVSPSVAVNEDLQLQLTRITRQRNCLEHDDEIDSLANACALFGEHLNEDPESVAELHRQQKIDDELKNFRQLAGVGAHDDGPSWIQYRH